MVLNKGSSKLFGASKNHIQEVLDPTEEPFKHPVGPLSFMFF